MESSNFACNMKIPKLEVEDAKGNDIDRISNLPKELLQHILRFLSTKDAVRTSILSKKWEYLWTSIDVLDFEEGPAKRKLFTYFVERVLVLHSSLNLRKFALSCTVQADAPHINSWILAALRRNVKELHLSLKSVRDSSVFPRCFFTCASITTLVLTMTWLPEAPKLISFPSLKILILSNVVFSDDDAVHQLFFGCPVLETLRIHECNWLSLTAITISSPTLQSLEIKENNIQNRSYASGCQVMVYCESLKFFLYEGELKNDYCLCSVPSLVNACISISNWTHRPRDVAYRLNKLLVGLLSATSLTLSSSAVAVQGYAEELFAHLPVFNKLTHFTLYRGFLDLDYELVDLLDKFPRLECLNLAEGVYIQAESLVRVLNVVPASLWSNLKSIRVGCFKGSELEVYAAGMLLKNASALDCLVIFCDELLCADMRKLKSIRDELFMRRSSTKCKVVLSFRKFQMCSHKFP